MRARMLLALVAAILIFAALAPLAQAGYKTYGDVVDGSTTDKDITRILHLEVAGDDTVKRMTDNAQAIYLDLDGSDSITAFDIRIQNGNLAKGVFVRSADSDCCGSGLDAADGGFSFVDLYGFSAGGTVFTFDADENRLEAVAHGLDDGDTVLLSTTGSLPSGPKVDTVYFVINRADDHFQISTTRTGNPVTIKDGGSGAHSFHETTGDLNLGEPIYLDLNGNHIVDTGDVKIMSKASPAAGGAPTTSGSAAMAAVTDKDPEIGATLIDITGYALNAFDANGNGVLDSVDTVYLDLLNDQVANSPDIRLNKPASGSSLAAGTMVKPGDADMVYLLRTVAGAAIRFHDENNNGVAGANEAIYLDMDMDGEVSVNDIRLMPATGTTNVGKQVVSGDSDLGLELDDLEGANAGLRFNDRNSNGIFDADDVLYIDINGDTNSVAAGDIRLTKGTSSFSAGQRVTASSSGDLNSPLIDLGAHSIAFVDVDGAGTYTRHDPVYIDMGPTGYIAAGDVLLGTSISPFTGYGTVITDARAEMTYCYAFDFLDAEIAYYDAFNTGSASLGDMVYLDRAGTGVTNANDLRLATVTGGAGNAGTFVSTSNNDHNQALTLIGLTLSFADANGDSIYSAKGADSVGDTIYIDVDGNDQVSVRDVRVTKASVGSGPAGAKVDGNAPAGEQNLALQTLTGAFFAIDSNGDQTLTSLDAMYYDVDEHWDDTLIDALGNTNCVTPGDVRLSGTSSGSSGGSGGGTGGGGTPVQPTDPGTEPTDPGTEPTDPGTGPTQPTEPTDPGNQTDPDGDGIPGPGILVALALVAAALIVRRRR